MEAALEAYFKYNSKRLIYSCVTVLSCFVSDLTYLFIIDYIYTFSNGRRSTDVGVSVDGLTACSTASAAIRIRTGVRRKIASPLLRIAEKTSILQRYPRRRHASD